MVKFLDRKIWKIMVFIVICKRCLKLNIENIIKYQGIGLIDKSIYDYYYYLFYFLDMFWTFLYLCINTILCWTFKYNSRYLIINIKFTKLTNYNKKKFENKYGNRWFIYYCEFYEQRSYTVFFQFFRIKFIRIYLLILLKQNWY